MVEIPEEIKKYGFEINQSPKGVEKTVYNNLVIMREQAEKLTDCHKRYCQCNDERLKDDLAESMSSRINHLSQAFRDIMAFIEISEKDRVYEESMRYYVRQFIARDIPKTETERDAVEFLTKRNDLVHDYFNIAQLNYELVKALDNFGKGFVDLARNLNEYCVKHFPALRLEEDLARTIRKNTIKR